MTEDEKPETNQEAGATTEQATDGTATQANTESQPEPEVDAAAEKETEEQEAEAAPSVEDRLAETNDQLLRALAELENTRRRADRDRAEALNMAPQALPATC